MSVLKRAKVVEYEEPMTEREITALRSYNKNAKSTTWQRTRVEDEDGKVLWDWHNCQSWSDGYNAAIDDYERLSQNKD